MAEAKHPAIENLRTCQRQLDMDGCEVGVSRQALDETLALIDRLMAPSAEVLLGRLGLAGEPDNSRLLVMAQNPANNHHWSKSVGGFTAGEVRAAIAKAEGRVDG